METINALYPTVVIPMLSAIAVWTLLAGLIYLGMKVFRQGNPLVRYHVMAATLISLPVGIVGYFIINTFFSGTGTIIQLPATMGFSYELPAIVFGTGSPTEAKGVGSTFWDIRFWIPVLLMSMAMAGLFRLAYIYVDLKKNLKSAKTVQDGSANEMLNSISKKMGLKRKIHLMYSDGIPVPFTYGVINPVILLPEKNMEPEKLNLILMHEAVHIASNDYLVHLMELLVRHLFWFHPLVHVFYHQSAYWREVACDNRVIAAQAPDIGSYATMLYDFALRADGNPVFRAAMASEKNLLKRIKAMNLYTNNNNYKEISMKHSITAALCVLLITSGIVACSDLSKNPTSEGSVITEAEFNGRTYTSDEIIGLIQSMIDSGENELNSLRNSNAGQNLIGPISEHVNTLKELKAIVESGNLHRIVDENGQLMIFPAPPTPPAPGTTNPEDPELFIVVEQMPEIIGGMAAIYEQLTYPEIARRGGIEGRVIVQFVVEADGSVSNVNVVRSAGTELDNEAVRVIQNLSFKPGVQRGQNVAVQMTIPIVFKLQPDATETRTPLTN